jgi:flagellar hook assembly protein FlgD
VNFSFTMATDRPALIRVYDVAGRLVRTLINGNAAAGPHELTWDASDDRGRRVGAGVYFYRMDAGAWRSQRKVVFLER